MNLGNANTEPYYQFHRRCEEFDRTMRVTVAGLALVRQQQRTADGPVRLPTDGEPFGENLWNQPGQKVLPAKRLLAQMGVAHIITLLEDFCVGLKGSTIALPQARATERSATTQMTPRRMACLPSPFIRSFASEKKRSSVSSRFTSTS